MKTRRATAKSNELTHRERQILHLVSEGLSNKEIGRRLKVTDGNIKVHLHKIFEKLRPPAGQRARLPGIRQENKRITSDLNWN
jgi:DNA-binding NarL/FixJ family response regulator